MPNDAFIIALYDMSYMYTNHCSRQEEKFSYYKSTVNYTWEDAKAAYQLVHELPDYWMIVQRLARGN